MATYEKIGVGEYAIKVEGYELFQLYRLFANLNERGGCDPDEMVNLKLMFNGACEKRPSMTKEFADALHTIYSNMHILALSEEIIREMSDVFVEAYEEDTKPVNPKIQ